MKIAAIKESYKFVPNVPESITFGTNLWKFYQLIAREPFVTENTWVNINWRHIIELAPHKISGFHCWFWFGFGKFPLEITNFSIFSLRFKKISSGQVKKYLGQKWVGLLFTAGQKYARIGLGPFFSLGLSWRLRWAIQSRSQYWTVLLLFWTLVLLECSPKITKYLSSFVNPSPLSVCYFCQRMSRDLIFSRTNKLSPRI